MLRSYLSALMGILVVVISGIALGILFPARLGSLSEVLESVGFGFGLATLLLFIIVITYAAFRWGVAIRNIVWMNALIRCIGWIWLIPTIGIVSCILVLSSLALLRLNPFLGDLPFAAYFFALITPIFSLGLSYLLLRYLADKEGTGAALLVTAFGAVLLALFPVLLELPLYIVDWIFYGGKSYWLK